MRVKSVMFAAVLAAMLLELGAGAGAAAFKSGSKEPAAAPAGAAQDENFHAEGEKRFRSNCARCHAAPPRFAPRMMSTIVRHMRVRANITDQDMRLILRYMTE